VTILILASIQALFKEILRELKPGMFLYVMRLAQTQSIMVNPTEDYEQDQARGSAKQTIIIDERETGETDELDPKFSDPEVPATNPELDGEGIDESTTGLNPAEQESSKPAEDAGLNRDADDDLSLNKAQDDLF
jgi:hypothetical protein